MPGRDLTGSLVTSDQPIAVLGAHACANVPNGVDSCDYVVEQQPPDAAWGREFATVPLKHRLGGDTFRILASQDATDVSIDGVSVASLDAGGFHTQLIASPSVITASKPILVAQFSNGSAFDNTTDPFMSDPSMILVPPTAEYLTSYRISTVDNSFTENEVNLVVPDSAVGAVEVDGTAVAPSAYAPIGSSGFQGAQVDVGLGSHQLTGPGVPFGAIVYGASIVESYGHPAGMGVAGIPHATTMTLDPSGESRVTGTEGCVTAAVLDQHGVPVAAARVAFRASGANTASGYGDTDAAGMATWCYTGSRAGRDAIIATLGRVKGYATKVWTTAVAPPPPPPVVVPAREPV